MRLFSFYVYVMYMIGAYLILLHVGHTSGTLTGLEK